MWSNYIIFSLPYLSNTVDLILDNLCWISNYRFIKYNLYVVATINSLHLLCISVHYKAMMTETVLVCMAVMWTLWPVRPADQHRSLQAVIRYTLDAKIYIADLLLYSYYLSLNNRFIYVSTELNVCFALNRWDPDLLFGEGWNRIFAVPYSISFEIKYV